MNTSIINTDSWAKKLIIRHSKLLCEYLEHHKNKSDWIGFFVANKPIFMNNFQNLVIVGEYELSNQKYVRQSFVLVIKNNQIINSDILHKRDFQASIFVIANKLIDQFNDNAKNFYRDLLIYDRDCRQILDHDWHKNVPGNDFMQPIHPDLNGDRCMVAGQGYGTNIVHISLKDLKRYSLASGLLE
jgi:hypothetical protein